MTFANGTDNYFARQQVLERIAGLGPPDRVTPSIAPLFSPRLIYRYVLESPDRTPTELKTLEDWVVERQYRSVPGVGTTPAGGPTMQYQVLLDLAKIAGSALSVPMVDRARGQQRELGRRFLLAGRQFYYVRGLGLLKTPEDIGNVVLAVHNGTPILVKDVGTVDGRGAAPRPVRFQRQGRSRRGRDPHAPRRTGAGRSRTPGGENQGAQPVDSPAG